MGWNLAGFSCCVAGIVSSCRLEEIERALEEVASEPGLAEVRQACQGSWMLLGEWSAGTSKASRTSSTSEASASQHRRSADLWLWMSRTRASSRDLKGRSADGERPTLREIYCCGVSYRPAYHVVLFDYLVPGQLLTHSAALPRMVPRLVPLLPPNGEGSTSKKKPAKTSKKKDGGDGKPSSKSSTKEVEVTELQATLRQVNSCGPRAPTDDPTDDQTESSAPRRLAHGAARPRGDR